MVTRAGPTQPPLMPSSSRAHQKIPQPLFDQLKEGGRMVIPLGDRFTQSVWLVVKKDGKAVKKELKPTLFVPMTGKALKEATAKKAAEKP